MPRYQDEPSVTVQTPSKGPLRVPEWANKMAEAESVEITPGPGGIPSPGEMLYGTPTIGKPETTSSGKQLVRAEIEKDPDLPPGIGEPGTNKAKRHKYGIDGHIIVADHILSPDEIDAIKLKLTPPLSQHPYLAGAARIGGGVAGGIIGAATPIPGGAAIGAGLGAAAGEVLAEKLEGRKQLNAKEIAVQAGTSAIIPGPGKTVIGGIIKSGVHGVVSNTLASWAQNGETPDIGSQALAFVFGGSLGGVGTKLSAGRNSALRSSLREVLPTDVADGVHEVLTQGKLTTTVPKGVEGTLKEDVAETTRMLKDAKSKSPRYSTLPNGTVIETGAGGERRVVKPTVRVKLGKTPGEYEFSGPSQAEVTADELVPQKKQKFKMTKLKGGGWLREPIEEPAPTAGEPTGGRGVPGAEEKGPIDRPEGTAGISRIFTPSIWVFDRMQKGSGLPVYDEVYRPIRAAVESGDREAIKKVTHDVEQKFLRNESLGVPKDIRDSIEHIVARARGVSDGVLQDLEVTLKNIPGVKRYLSDKTIKDLAGNIVNLQYQGTLPGRVGPLLRNMSQTLQTGYMTLGERYYWRGIRETFTKRGYQQAESLGFLGPEHTIAAELQKGTSWYSKMMQAGFWPYKKIDDLNNAIMGLGQYHMTLDAARKARSLDEFIHRAKLDLIFPKAERDLISHMWETGNFGAAAQRAGLIRANVTQFLYGNIERPQILTQNTATRVALGFGNWPAFYANIFRELAFGDTPWQSKVLATGRLVAAHYALGSAAYGLYRAYGYNEKKAIARERDLIMAGPLFYQGGAALESAQAGINEARKVYVGESTVSRAARSIGRAAIPLIPGVQQARDIFGGREAGDITDLGGLLVTQKRGQYIDPSKEGYYVRIRKTLEDR